MNAYLIFVISFTQAGFSKIKFYTQKKQLKTPKTQKKSLKKSNVCGFFTQSGKIYTWHKIFTQAHQIWGMFQHRIHIRLFHKNQNRKSKIHKVDCWSLGLMLKNVFCSNMSFSWTPPFPLPNPPLQLQWGNQAKMRFGSNFWRWGAIDLRPIYLWVYNAEFFCGTF